MKRIHIESDLDSIFYRILTPIRIRIRIFNSNTDTNSDILEYECKTDGSDSDSNSDIYSIYRIIFSYFLLIVLEYKIIIYIQTKV
jgi:hypothetical protein